MTKLIVAFRNFAKMPKNIKQIKIHGKKTATYIYFFFFGRPPPGQPALSWHSPDIQRNTAVTIADFPSQIRAGHLSNTNQKQFTASPSFLEATDQYKLEETST